MNHVTQQPKETCQRTRDHWIQGSLKWICNSGLFGAFRAAEKKNPDCHKYATFEVSFLCFHCQKVNLNFF